ncbi:uncharacterized protein EURHEDRAFT_377514 [Aspergillus ruber CBS 135680]|uniref:Uncharacterized protein n=1 Tax=Aspergillus ruber (strain CBS 135680) TaxID=1388766 RepID=A0A017SGM8_ASPRC|nr:uncharacterized protein EURHEDRAFT_377514 [Aspergillus ruber CBS 135680]EYE95445.1 hypothetical protein EURHEDRAFT_377514 [Aspergillus ruber CBS 135680]
MAVQSVSQGGKSIAHKADIFAKPMHLENPMSSTLIVEIIQDEVQKNNMAWMMEKQAKSMPTALRDNYNPATDSSYGNNHVKDLLDTKDGTLSLIMDVFLTVPPPTLSADKLPVFEIEDSDLVKLDSDKPFPEMPPSAEEWEPANPLPDSQQWEDVHKAWKQPSLETGDQGQLGSVSRWHKAFNWDKAKCPGWPVCQSKWTQSLTTFLWQRR